MTRWMEGIEAPPFWAAQLGKPGPVDRWQIIRFEAPGTIDIDVGVAPAGTGAPEGDRSQGVNGFVLNTITPETATTCHYFWAFVRNYRITEQKLTTEIREGVANIFHEDEIILEAQQRAMDENPDRAFYNLNIDAGAMWARRLIDRMVARENVAADRAGGGVRRWPNAIPTGDVADRARAARAARFHPVRRVAPGRTHLRAAGGGDDRRVAHAGAHGAGAAGRGRPAGGDPLRRLHGEGVFRARHSGIDRAARHARRPRRALCRRARRLRAQPRAAEGILAEIDHWSARTRSRSKPSPPMSR